MRSSNAWTIKLWQRREWRLGFNSVFYNPNLFWSVSIYLFYFIFILFFIFFLGGGGGEERHANHAWLTSRLMAYAQKKIFGVKVEQTNFEGVHAVRGILHQLFFPTIHPTCSTIIPLSLFNISCETLHFISHLTLTLFRCEHVFFPYTRERNSKRTSFGTRKNYQRYISFHHFPPDIHTADIQLFLNLGFVRQGEIRESWDWQGSWRNAQTRTESWSKIKYIRSLAPSLEVLGESGSTTHPRGMQCYVRYGQERAVFRFTACHGYSCVGSGQLWHAWQDWL